ncbi:MAG: hypothetical protein IPL83_16535 [Bdellovibrionales bacterium]|nr:hypothetical protein [Bdellovibrionales bacterium]
MKGDSQDSISRPKRKLSRFLARKMLYDYITGNLDSARMAAVEEFVLQDWETKRELEHIQEGLKYCSELSFTKISQPLIQEIRDHKDLWGRMREGRLWKDWPDAVKWGIEAIVISSIAGLVAIKIPWGRVGELLPKASDKVILVEVEKSDKGKQEITAKGSEGSDQGEGHVSTPLSATTPPVKPLNLPAEKAEQRDKPDKLAKPSSSVKPVVSVAKTETSRKADSEARNLEDEEVDSSAPADVDSEDRAQSSTQSDKPMKNFVYRAFMSLDKLEDGSSQIASEIKRLGGVKAGQVELGWKKPKGSYFHFSIPESNYEELLKILRTFGPVRIDKEPHWRVVPQGQIRFILWVEDNKVK